MNRSSVGHWRADRYVQRHVQHRSSSAQPRGSPLTVRIPLQSLVRQVDPSVGDPSIQAGREVSTAHQAPSTDDGSR
jgi:hypothetical protein